MIRGALNNPIAVLMASIAIVVFALVVAPRLTVDTFPELTPPVLVIGTQVPGMGPKDVEKTITWRLEKFVSATPGIDHVQSVSRSGLSVIYVWLAWGTDLNAAQSLVQQQVAFAMSSIPKSLGVIPPFVLQYDPTNAPVLQVAVYGGGLTEPQLYDFAANVIEPELEGIAGVASAAPNGGRERQINIVVDAVKAQAHGLSASDVGSVVARANALLPSGRLIAPDLDANVYTNAVPLRVSDIGDAMIAKRIRVKDVARVEDGGTPTTQAVSVNGEAAVYLNVLRVPGGNILQIVDAAKAKIEALQGLPPGMKVEAIFDSSTFVRNTFTGLKKEVLQAFLLVALVILVFLQSPRSVLVAAIAVPISFAAIFIALYVSGQTLNAFTLGGLTLAMGPLVDISVVVLEAVHQRRAQGESPADAAGNGTSSVAVAALAATLSTVAVLLPVVLLQGLARKLFGPLAITVATGMIAGYVVSMLVTPVACRFLLGHHAEPPRIARVVQQRIERVRDVYVRALEGVLPVRWWLIGAATVATMLAVWAASRLPATFFPDLDEGMERVYVRFAAGTSLDHAAQQIAEMGTLLANELPKDTVKLVLTNVGSPGKARSAMNSPNSGPHMGFIRLQLADAEEREDGQQALADRSREILNQHFPGVDFVQAPGGIVTSVFANGYRVPGVVEVQGSDLESMHRASMAVAEVMRKVPGVRDVYVSLETDYPELRVETDREVAGQLGLSARDAAQTTLDATLGNINTPGVWVDAANGQSYYVVSGYDTAGITDAGELAAVPLKGPIRLGTYAEVKRNAGPIAIERNRLGRVDTIFFQTERRDIGSAAADIERLLRAEPSTREVKWSFVGQVALMRDTFSGLGTALALAVMVVFMVMATQFKSLTLPFAMLATIPVALVGIVLALLAAGQALSVIALMGVLMVIGIAVSNGILLVDHANRAFHSGVDPVAAALDAGRARFIPILMTSLATITGLLPTALGLDPAAAANQPLALSVVGGLASSTLMSLFLVPSMFVVLSRKRLPP